MAELETSPEEGSESSEATAEALTEADTEGAGAGTGKPFDPPTTLRRQGLFSVGWTGLSQVITMTVRLGSTLIMTRLLAPEAYGVFATAMAVIVTLEWFSDLGVMPALVRHPHGDQPNYLLTGWWINVMRGATLTLICILISFPLTQYYYRAPGLFPVLLALSSISTLQALRSPGMPRLRRELNYRAIFRLDLAQLFISTGVSLGLAWMLRSFWAIVWGTIAGTATATLVSYVLSPVRPRWLWDRTVAVEISRLSRQILVNTLVAALWLNADRLLGLRYATPAEMGLYAVAWNLVSFMEGMTLRVCEIYFSMLSRISDPHERADWHRRVCLRVALWGMPLFTAGVLLAPTLVRILYDKRYLGAGVLLSLLIARQMTRIMAMVQFQHLLSTAEVHIATRAYVVAAIAQVVGLTTLGAHFHVLGIAASSLISTMVLLCTQSAMMRYRGERCLSAVWITLFYVVLSVVLLAMMVR